MLSFIPRTTQPPLPNPTVGHSTNGQRGTVAHASTQQLQPTQRISAGRVLRTRASCAVPSLCCAIRWQTHSTHSNTTQLPSTPPLLRCPLSLLPRRSPASAPAPLLPVACAATTSRTRTLRENARTVISRRHCTTTDMRWMCRQAAAQRPPKHRPRRKDSDWNRNQRSS